MKEQVFFTDIEVFLITTYSLILVAFENKYKLPPKEDENHDDESINNSVNELLSNFSKHSNQDARITRQNALNRIMKTLDLKDKGEDMFGDKLQDAIEDPRMRYSLQERKNPYEPEDDNASELDKRKVETMPDLNIRDHENSKDIDKERDKFDRLFNGSRFGKMLSNVSKNDKSQPDKDPKKFDDEESKGLSLSEIRRNEEEDMQTDDQPSNDIDAQDKTDRHLTHKSDDQDEEAKGRTLNTIKSNKINGENDDDLEDEIDQDGKIIYRDDDEDDED